ncbi:restriction endonuclease subunit S, partial [Capnocytophaga granulosa]|uniref:restriction endonuclease subunit S n=1 Tax=Capnocytophaga granulosa TaxID=45242 RepID=UPI0023F3245E
VKCIDEEIPFEIPNGWEWTRISNIFQINPKNICNDELEVAFIPMEKLSAGYGSNYSYEKVKWSKIKKGFTHFANGDIAFAKITPCFQNRKSAVFDKLPNGIGAGTTELKILRTFAETINRFYLLYFLKSPYFIEGAIFKGTANQQRIISGYLENKLFPLPPLKEQQRIVEEIEELIPHIKHYGKAQAELDLLNKNIKEQLKKSVLQYAIEGKLVPQDETEGTAEELLLQIQKEKLKLYEENKLKKKDLEHSTIFKGEDNKYYEKIGKNVTCIDEEIPFETPKNWRWVRVKDIVQVNPKNEAADNTISAFIPMEKIKATFSSVYSYSEKKWGEIKSGFTHFSDGDIAFAKITPCFQNRKSMILQNLPNGIGAGTTELKVLRPCGITMNAYFLLFFLESPYFIEEAKFKGTANQQRILSGYLETKLLALPPLTEQQRIVNTIQNIFRCIEN